MYIIKNYIILEDILDDIDSTDSENEIFTNVDIVDKVANYQNSSETELEIENDTFQEYIIATSLQSTKHGKTYCFRFSAHTIQLCVYDGLKNKTNKEKLDKARKVNFIYYYNIYYFVFVIYVGRYSTYTKKKYI